MNAEPNPSRCRGFVRAVLSLGLLLSAGTTGTLAYWTDEGTVSTAPLSAGRLDVMLNGQLSGTGGSIVDAGFAVGDLVPGESFARELHVHNSGSVPFDYTATGYATGGLSNGLRWTVVAGASASNSGTMARGNRAGACANGMTTFGPAAALSTSAAAPSPVVSTRRPVNVGATERLCIVVGLDPNAAGALQGTTASAAFTVHAVQRGGA